MSNTVFILGAGASFSSGVPLMNEFWERGWELWKTNQIAEQYALHFDRVESALISLQMTHSKANLNYNNLESLVTALDMAGLIEKLPGRDLDDINELKESVAKVIIATIEATSTFKVQKESSSPAPHPSYEEFVLLIKQLSRQATPKHKVSIITFNYDVGLDYAIFDEHMGPEYCLSEEDMIDENIKLLKLHGSINWLYDKEKRKVEEYKFGEYLRNKNFSYRQKHGDDCYLKINETVIGVGNAGGQYRSSSFIAPPSWYKGEYHVNLKPVWKNAARVLEEAENIFIIGFSLPDTDLFFKNLYALGVTGKARLQRIWVFDPNSKLEPKYESFLGPTAKHKFEFNPDPDKNKIPEQYNSKGTFEYAMYSIATHFGIEDQFGGKFISIV